MAIHNALVVDDSKLARLTLGNMLKKKGLKVDEATSGGEALDYLLYNTPDVVFMDFMMPDMDGLEVTSRIVGNPKTASIPVVLCTAQDTPEDRVRAKEKGAQGFLTKPASEDSLGNILRELAARQPAVEVAPAAAVAVAAAAQPALDVVALRMEVEILARATAERTASHVAETLGKSIAQALKSEIKSEVKIEMLSDLAATTEETASEISRKVAESAAAAAAQRIAGELVRKAIDEVQAQLLAALKTEVHTAAETAARAQLQAALNDMQNSLRAVLSEQKQQFEMEFASNQDIVNLQTELRKTSDQAHKFAKDAGTEARKLAERYTDDSRVSMLQEAKETARKLVASGKTLPLVLGGVSLLVALGAVVAAVVL